MASRSPLGSYLERLLGHPEGSTHGDRCEDERNERVLGNHAVLLGRGGRHRRVGGRPRLARTGSSLGGGPGGRVAEPRLPSKLEPGGFPCDSGRLAGFRNPATGRSLDHGLSQKLKASERLVVWLLVLCVSRYQRWTSISVPTPGFRFGLEAHTALPPSCRARRLSTVILARWARRVFQNRRGLPCGHVTQEACTLLPVTHAVLQEVSG